MWFFRILSRGDDFYSNVLSTVPTNQKNNLQGYFMAGMDFRKQEYRFRVDKKYPETFNELEFDEERVNNFFGNDIVVDPS